MTIVCVCGAATLICLYIIHKLKSDRLKRLEFKIHIKGISLIVENFEDNKDIKRADAPTSTQHKD